MQYLAIWDYKMSITILTPELATYVSLTSPDTNNSGSATLFAGYNLFLKTQYTRRIYLSFDIDSLGITASGDINSAYLEIPLISIGGDTSYSYSLYNVNSLWDESTITWNNQPGPSGFPTIFTHTYPDDVFTWKSVDITTQVKQIVADNQNKGFVIKGTSESSEDGELQTPNNIGKPIAAEVYVGNKFDLVHWGRFTKTSFPDSIIPLLRIDTA